MKPFKIFSILLFSVVFTCLMLGTNSCTDQKFTLQRESIATKAETKNSEITTTEATPNLFDKTVGKPIDRKTALRWMENFGYTKSNPNNSEYFIKAKTLADIISQNECVGISFFYAVNQDGYLEIIPIGVNFNGAVIEAKTISISTQELDWSIAQAWISNYSGRIRSHFFGCETYKRLLDEQKAQTIRISMAMDDDGNPQLLLSNASDASPSNYEDASRPCPPFCPTN